MTEQFDNPKRGFTLIELLVVIGILGLLLAILLPVFFSVRGRARATACTSNLQQLHLALSLYAADNGGYLPPYNTEAGRSVTRDDGTTFQVPDQSGELVASVAPYLQAPSVWFCPADPFAGMEQEPVVNYILYNNRYTSYKYCGGITFSHGTLRPLRLELPNTATVPLLTDNKTGTVLDLPAATGPGPYSHGKRFNILYRDGHVRSLSWDDRDFER